MVKETYYFSHDSNAITDTKILNMRSDYGLEGYGLYWVILEMMRNEKSYMLTLDKNTYRAVKTLSNTTIDVEKYIDDCINDYQLFISENDNFYSKSFLERMLEYESRRIKNRQNGQLGGRPKNNPDKTEIKPTGFKNETQKNQSKRNEKKTKESKVKEIKIHYADLVSMTNVEYEKLVNTYGKSFADKCIYVLDNYKGSCGKRYESDYRAILSWVVDKVKASSEKSNNKFTAYEQRQYDDKQLQKLYANSQTGGAYN